MERIEVIYVVILLILRVICVLTLSIFIHKTRKANVVFKWFSNLTHEDIMKKNLFLLSLFEMIGAVHELIQYILLLSLDDINETLLYYLNKISHSFHILDQIWIFILIKSCLIAIQKSRKPTLCQEIVEPVVFFLTYWLSFLNLELVNYNHYVRGFLGLTWYLIMVILTLILVCKINSKTTKLCGFIGLLLIICRCLTSISFLWQVFGDFYFVGFYFDHYFSLCIAQIFFILFPILALLKRFDIFDLQSMDRNTFNME